MFDHRSHHEAPKTVRRRLTPAEQISAAKASLARAQARQRQHDTRSKIVLGGTVLAWVRNDARAAQSLLLYINSKPLRQQDVEALSVVRDELFLLTRNNAAGASHDSNT